MPVLVRMLPLALATALLPGCQPKLDAPAPPANGAADDRPATLMAQVFDGWAAAPPHAASVPSGQGSAQENVLVSPLMVVPLDADHRVLVVVGVPDEGSGQPLQLNATQVNVGAYGFERREGRWARTFAQPSLTWAGSNGQPGQVKVHPLGPGRTALSLQDGFCAQDVCSAWLHIFALTPAGAQALTPGLKLSHQLEGAPGCARWLAGEAEATDADAPITPENCVDVSGRWHFETSGAEGWPDLVLAFKGRKAGLNANGALDSLAADGELRLRHDGSGYKVASGRNPLD